MAQIINHRRCSRQPQKVDVYMISCTDLHLSRLAPQLKSREWWSLFAARQIMTRWTVVDFAIFFAEAAGRKWTSGEIRNVKNSILGRGEPAAPLCIDGKRFPPAIRHSPYMIKTISPQHNTPLNGYRPPPCPEAPALSNREYAGAVLTNWLLIRRRWKRARMATGRIDEIVWYHIRGNDALTCSVTW